VTIAVVGELVVGGRKLLEALCSDGCEIAFEIGELDEDHRPSSHETVDQRLLLLRHFFFFVFSLSIGGFLLTDQRVLLYRREGRGDLEKDFNAETRRD